MRPRIGWDQKIDIFAFSLCRINHQNSLLRMSGYLFLEGSDSLVGTPVDSENVPAANSVTPDGSPMLMRDVGTSEIYALDVDAFLMALLRESSPC
jgi:hypothetical protein